VSAHVFKKAINFYFTDIIGKETYTKNSLQLPVSNLKRGSLVNNSNKMHKSQSLFYLTTALHVSGVTITHLQEHKTIVTTGSGNRYTVIDRVKFTDNEYR